MLASEVPLMLVLMFVGLLWLAFATSGDVRQARQATPAPRRSTSHRRCSKASGSSHRGPSIAHRLPTAGCPAGRGAE